MKICNRSERYTLFALYGSIHDTHMALLRQTLQLIPKYYGEVTATTIACNGVAVVHYIPTVAHARMFPQLLEESSHSTNLQGKWT